MKITKCLLILFTILSFSKLSAQSENINCAILNVNETNLKNYSSKILGNITRREFSKLNIYTVLYAEDIKPILAIDSLLNSDPFSCYSKQCLVRTGNKIGADKILSGQIEQMRDGIIISFRLIDVKENRVEHSITKEFLSLEDQLKNMIIISIREMMGLENDKELEAVLLKKFSRENYINNKGINRLNLSGTRMGVVTLLGSNQDIIKGEESAGGFDAVPVFFNFGYQFESQYLNQRRVQGLFEFIPSITGLEQGLMMPSITILHGIRDNKTGFEFAFGPSFGITQVASGYYDDTNTWQLESHWNEQQSSSSDTSITNFATNPSYISKRLDSRGDFELSVGFLIGLGFSIKSGEINIPVNIYTVFQKNALRTGISLGINTRKRKK
jgi:hypothetical protein